MGQTEQFEKAVERELRSGRARTAERYLLALLLVGGATLLRWLLPSALSSTPYLAFYPALVAAAGLCGMGPGLLATVASLLTVDLLFDETPGRIVLGHVVLLRLIIFGLGGIGISVFAGLKRSAQARERQQAKELSELANRYRSFVTATAQIVWNMGPTGAAETDLPLWRAFTGQSEEEIRGFGWMDAIHPEDRGRVKEVWRRASESRQLYEAEYRLRAANGDWRDVLARGVPILNGEGAVQEYVGTCIDVTERKRAEAALRDSETRFRGTFENAAVGITHLDTQGRFIRVNQKFRDILGLPCEELVGRDFRQLTHAEDLAEDSARFAAMIRGEVDSYSVEKRYSRRDGTLVWVQVTRSVQRDASGKALYSISVVQDIGKRKRAEQALLESESFYRQTLESIPGMVFTTRPDGYCDYRSQQWIDYTGVPMSEHLGDGWNRSLHPDDQPRSLAAWRAAVEGKGPYDLEYRVRRHDGAYEWFKVIGRPIRDAAGQIVRWFGIATNIENLKRAEEALRDAMLSAERAKAAAEQASRAKDHFMAVLSHELRTPLTPVLAMISMLQENGLDQATRESLEVVRRNVELEARLIDDLLDVTRIARGKVKLEKHRIELCTVIARAVEVCRPDIEARRLEFGIDLGPRPYWVEADAARLQQVFWNLLKNAIKFTPHGGCIGVRCRPADHAVVVEVNDSGIGIEPDALARIFNAFEQAEFAIAKQFGGLGLGLTICKALVEMHGGTIGAESAGKGRGATFKVRLPLTTPAQPDRKQGLIGPAETVAEGEATNLRILFVEDHGDTANIMKRLLERQGHRVQTAGDVARALELAGAEQFDLLISDLGLPDGSGLDLMRQLRGNGAQLKGIALSGYGMEQDVQRSREAGFNEHLTKPVDVAMLHAAIARVISPKGSD